MPQAEAPPLIRCTRFALYAFLTGKTDIELGRELNCHPMSVGRYRRPFDAPGRRVPPAGFRTEVETWSDGAVPADSWTAPIDGGALLAAAAGEERAAA